MDSSVSLKDQIWFLRVCHHVLNELYLKQAISAVLGLFHCDSWWLIPSCMPSLIFRLDGHISRNPLKMQPGGRYGQRAFTRSRRFGKPALEVCKFVLRLTVHRSSIWNKKPTRCHLVYVYFYLSVAQHVSGQHVPIRAHLYMATETTNHNLPNHTTHLIKTDNNSTRKY